MSADSAWRRMMDYCDGKIVYLAGSSTSREHLRTDIMQLNDARLNAEAAVRRSGKVLARKEIAEGAN